MKNTEAQQVISNILMSRSFTDIELEALVMAGEALDDEALPPTRNARDMDRCPRCNQIAFAISGDYCPHCGQHIDWGIE